MQDKLSDLDAYGVPKHVMSEYKQINELFLHNVQKNTDLTNDLRAFDGHFETVLYQIQNKDNDIKKNRAQHKEEVV